MRNFIAPTHWMNILLYKHMYSFAYLFSLFYRLPFIAGNWKMNTDLKSAIQLANEVVELTKDVLDRSLSISFIQSLIKLLAHY